MGNKLVQMAIASVCCIAMASYGVLGAEIAVPREGESATKPVADGNAGAELLLFQDLPIVVSASRQSQPLNLSAVPVSVITHEDIHYSAHTALPEIFQFVPGIDVMRIDRNNYAIGVRGLHHTYADRTLTLINGRNANSPAYGGANFVVLPVMLEDIERIEVVRGPGGAAWGANAFNGVINIITKAPEDVRGTLISSSLNDLGDSYTQIRWAEVSGKWAWRVSGGYDSRVSSLEALDGDAGYTVNDPAIAPLLAGSGVAANDFSRDARIDSEVTYRFSEETKFTAGVAGSQARQGSMEVLGTITEERSDTDLVRAFARLDYNPDRSTSGYLQWFGNYESIDQPAITTVQDFENDLESQFSFQANADHRLTIGGNVRADQVDWAGDRATDLIRGTFDEYWAGAFVMDRWQLTRRLAVEGQLRGDWYSETDTDWSGRLTGLTGLDDANRHVVRVSVARAFRAPLSSVRELEGARFPLPVPAPFVVNAVNIAGSPDLENEHVTAVETGYNGQLTDHVMVRVDGYYQRYEDLIGGTSQADPLGLGRQFTQLANVDGGDGYGAEVELAYTHKAGRASIWYAYNGFTPDQKDQNTRSFEPIQNQAGINARWFVGDGWTASANYKFTSAMQIGWGEDVDSAHQLDLVGAKRFFSDHAEVAFGVADLFDNTNVAIPQDGQFTSHETPGRTFFVRLQASW